MYAQRSWLCKLGIILGLTVVGPGAYAVTIHTWIDGAGVRHFSQFPPAEGEQAVDTLVLENPPPAPAQDRLQTIRDVARDLELSRQQREQQRAAEAAAQPATPPVSKDQEPESQPIFIPYPYDMPYPRPPHPPGRHPHGRKDHDETEDHEPTAPRARIYDKDGSPRP